MTERMFALLGIVPMTLALGCAADDPVDAWPRTSGEYLAEYVVPTPDHPELAEAAVYPVDHIEWTVAGDTATLHYDLPPGLVGGDLDVTMSGSIAGDGPVYTLTSGQGTATCSIDGTIVTCNEAFQNLGALPIDSAVVEQRAAAEYAGPVAHRLTVAGLFDAEPLGVLIFDLTVPGIEEGDDD